MDPETTLVMVERIGCWSIAAAVDVAFELPDELDADVDVGSVPV